ncbi:MAG TPA: hypothetical protein VM537_33410 [Anaerolineae bacterium]|nr:hypothetical protein [Anaerolineae bacterium]
MTLMDQRLARSEVDLRQAGYTALIETLGYGDAIRFLVQISPGEGNYLEWQDRVFGDKVVDQLYDQAEERWSKLQR